MILFFDSESSGLADLRAEPHAAHQPRLVQLAAMLTDETGVEVASLSVIIKPDGFEIPEAASAIHGITTERAKACGVGVKNALRLFRELWDDATLAVGHNIEFDLFLIDGECYRAAGGIKAWAKASETFCTMKAMTPICKLTGKYSDYKWPKLQEAHQHAFGSEFDGAHDALADVRACARIYFWMKAQGFIKD